MIFFETLAFCRKDNFGSGAIWVNFGHTEIE